MTMVKTCTTLTLNVIPLIAWQTTLELSSGISRGRRIIVLPSKSYEASLGLNFQTFDGYIVGL